MTSDSRLRALEERVEALEAALAGAIAPSAEGDSASIRASVSEPATASSALVDEATRAPGVTTADDTFWALEGLQARYPAPGAVFLTGDVDLPTGTHVSWQQGAVTGDVLDTDWTAHADSLAALGHPVRLRLLQEVLAGHTTAAELTALEGMGTSGQVYHHLRQLTAAGWLRTLGGGRHEVPAARVVPLLVMMLGAQR